MNIEIQKNMPIFLPKRGGGAKGVVREAMEACEVGDSFFATVKQPLATANLLKPKKFATRVSTENGVKGVRIWRIL